jgi:hypothetical protein
VYTKLGRRDDQKKGYLRVWPGFAVERGLSSVAMPRICIQIGKDPRHQCVYTISSGLNLYRKSSTCFRYHLELTPSSKFLREVIQLSAIRSSNSLICIQDPRHQYDISDVYMTHFNLYSFCIHQMKAGEPEVCKMDCHTAITLKHVRNKIDLIKVSSWL